MFLKNYRWLSVRPNESFGQAVENKKGESLSTRIPTFDSINNTIMTSSETWPLPKFFFKVNIGEMEATFQEVTGLQSETQVIEYRAGDSPVFSNIKMPGIKKFGNITLKKGIFTKNDKLWDFYGKITMNTIKRETVVISLLDESGAIAMKWTLTNAFPCKMTIIDMKSDGDEIAVESMELAHEGLSISNG